MGKDIPFYRAYLKEELERRIQTNPQYSLRAFASALDLDPTYLSKVLNGKLMMSVENADRICEVLNLVEETRRDFLLSVAEERRCHSLKKVAPDLTDCD